MFHESLDLTETRTQMGTRAKSEQQLWGSLKAASSSLGSHEQAVLPVGFQE